VDGIGQFGGVGLLGRLSRRERDTLGVGSRVREWQGGEIVFSPAQRPRSVHLLTRGRVRVYRAAPGGREATLRYVRPGELFGELAAFGSQPRESFAVAVVRSTVLEIERAALLRLLSGRADLALEVLKQVGMRLERMERRVEDLVFRDVRARVARALLLLAEDFGRPEGEQVGIDIPLSQAELATLVGATRQTVNGVLSDLEDEGVLRVEHRRIVLLRVRGVRSAAELPAG
jgi:CRP-like cAMP-binding protein